MKFRSILFCIYLGLSFSVSYSAEQGSPTETIEKLAQAEGTLLPLLKLGVPVALLGFSWIFVQEKTIGYMEKYTKLLSRKKASDQLIILLQAKESINAYTSPLENKILSDLIWLHGAIAAIIKGKSPIEQISILDEYKKQHVGGKKLSLSLLSQNSWFARNFYCTEIFWSDHGRIVGKKFFMDEGFDRIFAGGFIREIFAKNKGLINEVIKKKYF